MPPEYDMRNLSNKDLIKICEAGEEGAGYHLFQVASALLVHRELPASPDMQDLYVEKFDQSEIDTINKIIGV